MMEDSDMKLARQLQKQFDREPAAFSATDRYAVTYSFTTNERSGKGEKNVSVIDPCWEITDPNPDVHVLFTQFNIEFFWGKLAGVEVKWSPRMTLCAGLCSYEGRGGLCSIRLSVPLLKLRPRKDLVETLLHEMIHAYLFVTDNDRDRDGHGPNFTKHMNRINEASGAKITIYHDFHDEVESYRQHWWRCEGPCKDRPPFYGWVKRSMNRAPSAKDFWWEDHRRSCGGTYKKVKEPEGYGQKKKAEKDNKESKSKEKAMVTGTDIRSFFGKGQVLGGAEESKNNPVLDSDKKSKSKTMGSNSLELKGKGNQTDLISRLKTKIVGDFNSGGSINNKRTSGTAGKIGNKNDVPLNQVLAVPSRREGGIWSGNDEFTTSTSKPGVTLKDGQKSFPLLGPRKTWTAAAPEAAKKGNCCSSDSAGSSGSLQGGYVLGSHQQGSLTWLARMRKEWMSQDDNKIPIDKVENNTKSATSNEPCKTFQGNKDDAYQIEQSCAQDKNNACRAHYSSAEISSNEMLASDNIENMLSPWSDENSSLHDSFHVSSCEIDEWPSPDKYPDYLAPTSSSVCQMKRKCTALDLSSSDEEEKNNFNKYLKLQKSSGSDCTQDLSGKLNDFQKFKSSSPVKDTRILPNACLLSVMATQSNSQWNGKQFSTATNYSNPSLTSASSSNNYSDDAENRSASLPNSNACEVFTDQSLLECPELNVISSTVECPSCGQRVPSAVINDHLDTCLG